VGVTETEREDKPISRAVEIIPGRMINLLNKFQKSVGSDDPLLGPSPHPSGLTMKAIQWF